MAVHNNAPLLRNNICGFGLGLDAIRGNIDYYWWVDVIGDYAVGTLAAFLWYRHSKRNA